MALLAGVVVCLGIPLILAAFVAHAVHLPQFTRRVALVVYVLVFAAAGLVPLSAAFRP